MLATIQLGNHALDLTFCFLIGRNMTSVDKA